MVWTQAMAVAVLAAVDASAQGLFSLSQQEPSITPSATTSMSGEVELSSNGQFGSIWTPTSGSGLSSATVDGLASSSPRSGGGIPPTTPDGISRTSSASTGGGSSPSEGGPGSSSGLSNGDTVVVSSSTHYFTVTTGFPGSSHTGPVTSGGSTTSIRTGGLSSSQASSASVSGTILSKSAIPSSNVFVIEIGPADPSESSAPGSKARRQSGGYMGNAGVNNPVDCSQATQFSIIDGELTRGGQRVSTGPGAAPGRLAVSPIVGSITRAWEIVDEELLWVNASFADGQARFCVDSGTHAVFFTTTGAGNEPAGCVPVELTLLFVNDCAGLNPGGDLLPAEETLILPPAVYFPAEAPRDQVCRVTTEYWTIGQFTVAPAPTGTGLNRRQ